MKWVLVTGSNGGIGSAICTVLRNTGFSLLGIDKRLNPHGELDKFIHADITDILDDEVYRSEFADEVHQTVGDGQLVGLVNNAAVQILGSIEKVTIQDFRETLDVNVAVPLALSQICFDLLVKSSGTILNVGSIHASLTKPGFISYSTSKAAIAGLTRALAVDVGDRVKVLGIQPAAIATQMLMDGFADDPDALSELKSYHPSKSIGEPLDIAEFVAYLISSKCQFLNGTMLDVNGGIGARLHDPV